MGGAVARIEMGTGAPLGVRGAGRHAGGLLGRNTDEDGDLRRLVGRCRARRRRAG